MLSADVLNLIHNADVRTLKNRFPVERFPVGGKAGFVDVVVTSPPYFDVIDYDVEGQIGFGQAYGDYLQAMRDVFEDCHRITKPNASFWLIADSYRRDGVLVPLPFELARMAAEVGWSLKDVVIWDKGKTRPWSKDGQFRNRFEYILLLVKDPKDYVWNVDEFREVTLTEWWRDYPHRYSEKGKIPSNIWRHKIPNQGSWANVPWEHDCPFPVDLAYRMVAISTSRRPKAPPPVVFDPFAGSGTVLAVAEQLGCNFLGFELNPKFVTQFYDNVRPTVAARWEEFIIDVRRHKEQQKHLERLIPKLRKTRFPKQLHMQWSQDIWKQHKQLHGDEADNVECDPGFLVLAYAIRSAPRDAKAANSKQKPVELAVILRDGASEELKQTVKSFCAKAPLSKFGLVAEVCTLAPAELPQWFGNVSRVYVYDNGKTWDFARKMAPDNVIVDVMETMGQILATKDLWNPKRRAYPPIYADESIRGTECDVIEERSIMDQFAEDDKGDLVEVEEDSSRELT